jgi:hypothetical protein
MNTVPGCISGVEVSVNFTGGANDVSSVVSPNAESVDRRLNRSHLSRASGFPARIAAQRAGRCRIPALSTPGATVKRSPGKRYSWTRATVATCLLTTSASGNRTRGESAHQRCRKNRRSMCRGEMYRTRNRTGEPPPGVYGDAGAQSVERACHARPGRQ